MHSSKIVLLINESARAMVGVYEDTGSPAEFKTLDPTIQVDDLVVVESGTRHGMTVVKITEADVDLDFEANKEVKWIVCRINTEAHNDLLRQEREAINAANSAERRRKREELRASMFADHQEQMKTLSLASQSSGKDEEVTE